MPSGATQGAAAKTVVGSVRIPIGEVSLAADSGWRSLDGVRVDELKASFERGEYGQNLLRKPTLINHVGQPILCTDGLLKIADGKHTFQALMELQEKMVDNDQDGFEDETPWTESLMIALRVGVDVSVIEFDDYDEDVLIAWAAGLHDVDSNKYKASSLKDLFNVVERYRRKVPGGSWAQTQTVLENLYGKGRRMFVYRSQQHAR
jgi:hypothetical protein